MSGSYGPPSVGGSANWAVPGAIGSTTPNTVVATDLTSSGKFIEVPSAVQILTATSTITPNAGTIVISSASSITLTSNPQVGTGFNGQQIQITNVGSFNINFANGNGLILGRPLTLFPGRTLNLAYRSTYTSWVDAGIIDFVTTANPNANNLQVASTAYVNTSNQPHARAGRSTDQTGLASGTATKIIWNNVASDIYAIVNTATGDITTTAWGGGVYRINASLGINTAINAGILSICVTTGSSELLRLNDVRSASDTIFSISGSASVALAANTSYFIQLYQTSVAATAKTILLNPVATYLTISRENV